MTDTRTAGVEDVLRAIERYTFAPMLPPDARRALAGPIAIVTSGSTLHDDQAQAALRVLHTAAEVLAGPLGAVGLELPALAAPVEHAQTRATRHLQVAAAVVGPDGRIAVDCPEHLLDIVRVMPGARAAAENVRIKGILAGKTRLHPTYTLPATPAAAATLIDGLDPFGGLRTTSSVKAMAASYHRDRRTTDLLDESIPLVDAPDGTDEVSRELWEHQRRSVALGEQAAAILLAVPMGGGKTISAIAIINRTGASTVLINCPNRVRAVWMREVAEQSVVSWHIEDGTRPAKRRGYPRQDLPQPERLERAKYVWWDCTCGAPVHAFVNNYEALTQPCWQEFVPDAKLDVIVHDEGHRLKNPDLQPAAPGRRKGPAERKLGPGATAEQREAAQREDRKGPNELALPDDASDADVVKAQGKDMLLEKRAELERAKRLTTSGMAARLVDFSHKRIALTGTPFPQHPWDIFGLFRALDPSIFGMEWGPFRDEYVQMDQSGQFPVRIKPEKMAKFARLCMKIMYRPTVDLKLPGCHDITVNVALEPDARRTYEQFDAELWVDLRRYLADQSHEILDHALVDEDLQYGGEQGAPTSMSARNLLTRILREQQLTGGTLHTDPGTAEDGSLIPGEAVRVSWVKQNALAEMEKLPAAQVRSETADLPAGSRARVRTHQITGGILEQVGCVPYRLDEANEVIPPEPVVVYTRFRSDLDVVRDVAQMAGLRYGEVSGRRGDGLDRNARMNPDIDLCGVQIQAGGTGVDLTRSAVGIWYSLGYSVSDYDQARARQYRPGQTRPVRYVHIIAENTRDQTVYDAIKDRRDAVAAVLRAGGVEPSQIGMTESEPGPDPTAHVEGIDDARAAVPVPWAE